MGDPRHMIVRIHKWWTQSKELQDGIDGVGGDSDAQVSDERGNVVRKAKCGDYI